MDLIFWRHAEADDWTEGCNDLDRALTPRGLKQAERVGAWLHRQLPAGARVLCSPARRCEQTAQALGRKFTVQAQIAPQASADTLLEAAGWPDSQSDLVLLVGHQPSIGLTVARLLRFEQDSCAVRKGSVWWVRTRERDGDARTVLLTVQSPEML